ncbi:hypothetical protein GOP47_0002034 [Adiantum capillus-veneris]|uniref:Uncharacterized protein n=1 Tax=Adiantum capillus-veneris TaxID=13818 RepID=A0A9D4V9D9_ADICA|nr:hypothetical protein GOP47_0002034 [Adiantum capillus-veneris]
MVILEGHTEHFRDGGCCYILKWPRTSSMTCLQSVTLHCWLWMIMAKVNQKLMDGMQTALKHEAGDINFATCSLKPSHSLKLCQLKVIASLC